MTTLTPSSLADTSFALRLSSVLRASRSARRTSNFFLLASVARNALPRGRRKLRAEPSFTRTVSPMCPSLPTRSSKITSMELSPSLSSRGRGGDEGCARAQLEESIDDAEARKNGKGVFGSQNAAGVERDQHERPHLETARQRVRDCEALQRQRRAEPADADGEILRGRRGQGVGACETSQNRAPHRPRKRKRGWYVGQWPRKVARQLGGTSRGVQVHAQHHQCRSG